MSSTLHEAIAAARAGDIARAQIIAADVVRDDPDDPNGWYLLSQLVDSDARRVAYLGKALALDPGHARARLEFDALPPALVDDLRPSAAPAVAEAMNEVASPPAVADAADVPEWLQPLSPEPVPPIVTLGGVAPVPATPVVPARPRPKPAAPSPARKNSGNQALAILLGLLALLTVVVLVFLVYLLFF